MPLRVKHSSKVDFIFLELVIRPPDWQSHSGKQYRDRTFEM